MSLPIKKEEGRRIRIVSGGDCEANGWLIGYSFDEAGRMHAIVEYERDVLQNIGNHLSSIELPNSWTKIHFRD